MLGGTFDPVHTGHLVLAQECWYRLELGKVIFIPAHMPPHKDVASGVSAADRLNMLRIALEGDDRFEISTYELDAGGTTYSIDTIRHFEKTYEKAEFFFLSGSDAAAELHLWKDVEEILERVTFVIAGRPGWPEESRYEDRIERLVIPPVDISSTMIRDRVRARAPIDHLVPASVVSYIRNKGLYR